MGNVIGNASQVEKDMGTEEWLKDIQENRILDFSRKVSHSQFLKHIQQEYTEACLNDLPWSILENVNLYRQVNGSFNNISSLSTNLPLRIPHLTHVNLSYNSLAELPSSIALLFHLKELLLRGNRLVFLPEEMCLLPELEMLDVSYNQLRSLPKGIGKLQKLTKLNVSHNFLSSIPCSLGLNPHLCVLVANNNICKSPPQEVCNSSNELLFYLHKHAPEVLCSRNRNHFPRIRSNVARSQLDDDVRTQNVASYVQTLTQTTKPASRAKTPLVFPTHGTKWSPDDLRDKIIGLVYGAVLGDTLGVATEYLMADEINFYYGGGRLDHHTIVQDEHRSHFQRGKTTCVSDFALLIFDSILRWSGVLDELELARCLLDYSTKGIKDLNSEPLITSSVVNRLLSQERFPHDPHGVARETAQLFNEAICEDLHALPMAIMCGLPQFYNLSEVQSNAARVCRTTHNHDRVVKSASLLASMVALILQGCEMDLVNKMTDIHIFPDREKRTISEFAYDRTWEEKDELDRVISAAYFCLGEKEPHFEMMLRNVLFLGGQSRIYGTVCGSILGCRSGYASMPARWIEGIHSSVTEWLNERLNHLLDMMGLP
ncbi:uncharacterized protein LOC130689916 [Daphnia carinata]|uniref:uncharacterized protein LOC130689916 n=1 Tax=Daphnia carinata TaxID=120202 RepID=UPI0025804FE0|nr:uncharacterized protein LOC130689916 [Daphnia carinata]